MTPSAKREVLAVLVQEHGVPMGRACQAVRLSRAAYYRPPRSRLVWDADIVAALKWSRDIVAGDSGSASIADAGPGIEFVLPRRREPNVLEMPTAWSPPEESRPIGRYVLRHVERTYVRRGGARHGHQGVDLYAPASGRLNWKVAPLPTSGEAQIRPP